MTKKKNGKKSGNGNGNGKPQSDEGAPVPQSPPEVGVMKLEAHSGVQFSNLDDLQKFTIIAEKSGLFGPGTAGQSVSPVKVAQGVVKLQRGMEVGLPPVAALQNIYIVDGKPCFSSGAIAGLIRGSGKYTYTVASTNTECVIQWFERYRGEREPLGQSSFSMEDAKRAGLSGRNPWKKFPASMLFARALTQGARMFCGDVFLGTVYTAEELSGGEIIDADLMPAAPERKPINKPGEMFNDD